MFFKGRMFLFGRIILILALLRGTLGTAPVEAASFVQSSGNNTKLLAQQRASASTGVSNIVHILQNSSSFPTVIATSPQQGDVLLNNPSTLSVQFSTNMLADGTAFAVNRPTNYLLVEDGADGKFQTTSCASRMQGDDTFVDISQVTYNATNFTSRLTIPTWPLLNRASYQLLVCATTRITDISGNRLNDGFDPISRFVLIKDVDLYPYANYGGGSGHGVGIGDFNHDGLTDLVMSTDSQVLVYLKNGNGGFDTPVVHTAGSRSEVLEVGDLNNDGRDDVVTADFSSNKISVFSQQSDGTLAARVTYATSFGPDAIAVNDVTGDGLEDVVISHWNAPYLGAFVQGVTGTLNPMTTYASPSAGSDDISIGDVNNDGRNDIVKMNGQNTAHPNLSIYLQNASGTLDAAIPYSLGCSCMGNGVAIGDVTNDGRSDIVMSYGGNRPSSKVAVIPQGADGTLQSPVTYEAYDIPQSVELADINRDGDLDILVLQGGWDALGVFLQKNGEIQPYSLYTIPNVNGFEPQSLDVGDINQDGAMYVAIADDIYGLTALYYHEKSAPQIIMGGNTLPIDGDELKAGISQLSVQFDRQMRADGSSASVDNASNYLLVEAGPDDTFQTDSCVEGVTGDDEPVAVDSVTYDDTKFFSTLSVNNSSSLSLGAYRLFACGTQSIEDSVGRKLNDGLSDAIINFTVWPTPYKISGNAGIGGALLSYVDGTSKVAIADGVGDYAFYVSDHWAGTVTPSKATHTFAPANKTYTDITSDLSDEDYMATLITYTISGNTGVGFTFLYFGSNENVTSDENGDYSLSVPAGWSGLVHAIKSGYRFTPIYHSYYNVQSDVQNQNFSAERLYTISGNAGIPAVTLSYVENGVSKTTVSYGSGSYSFQVPEHWSGTVVPSKTDYVFNPDSRSYSDIQADQTLQDYTAIQTRFTISGNVRHSEVTLSYIEDGSVKTVTSGSGGIYSFKVNANWSGTVTPFKAGVIFEPVSKNYQNVQSNLTAQNYKASIPVTTTADSGLGSLREAINGASYGDMITFHPDLAGQTITLASTLGIGKGLMINGSTLNPRVEISGNNTVQIFAVDPRFDSSGSRDVKFLSLILKNSKGAMGIGGGNILIDKVSFIGNTAYDGGAIAACCYNTSITIVQSEFKSNSAQRYGGAISVQFGKLTIQGSIFTDNIAGSVGGAISIERQGPYTFEDNTFINNTGLSGGAIRFESVESPVILRRNLFSGNKASLNGGAIFESLSFSTGLFTIENNTFYGNEATNKGGGLVISNGAIVRNNTFSHNKAGTQGGGSAHIGSAYLYNNILANNAGGGECTASGFGSAVGNHNLIENGSGLCSKLTNTIVSDPMLGSIADNGGFTQTMALNAGSPAIDAADDVNCLPTDQRGVTRPQGSHCDIGAYEYNSLDSAVDVMVEGSEVGSYVLSPHESQRRSFPGVNNGPLQLVNKNGVLMLAAERVIYKVKGVDTSFSEMMGLPNSALENIYWLPWYNNLGLDTQLRIANVTGQQATITVTIGGVQQPSFNLAAGESTRVNYPGVNSGPVKIESTQNIVAAERVIYKVKGIETSFSEMMALPNSQLDTVHWLPWYNNVDLDTQLRIANVSGSQATVTVTIGGVSHPSFNLAAGASTRVSYPGVNSGPVKIESTQNIVAAERVIYKVKGVQTSFSEMIAQPANQLSQTYWLPWYNNQDLDTQLRFGNVSDQTATVRVYIGGVEMVGSPFTLQPGESTRQSFPDINNGPMKITSNVPIVVAERVIYKVKGIETSFSEMMALPNALLDATFWFPWYNNVDLDTQLRFGVP